MGCGKKFDRLSQPSSQNIMTGHVFTVNVDEVENDREYFEKK